MEETMKKRPNHTRKRKRKKINDKRKKKKKEKRQKFDIETSSQYFYELIENQPQIDVTIEKT